MPSWNTTIHVGRAMKDEMRAERHMILSKENKENRRVELSKGDGAVLALEDDVVVCPLRDRPDCDMRFDKEVRFLRVNNMNSMGR